MAEAQPLVNPISENLCTTILHNLPRQKKQKRILFSTTIFCRSTAKSQIFDQFICITIPLAKGCFYLTNSRSKGNISGGARKCWRREPLGGSGGMLPQKNLKSRDLEMLFPAFSKSYLWFTHIANYLLRTLSWQTNAHWEYNTCNVNYKIENQLSLYLETSKCFTFQSHHSKFVVIKLSELP